MLAAQAQIKANTTKDGSADRFGSKPIFMTQNSAQVAAFFQLALHF